jgi:hypothetical protein
MRDKKARHILLQRIGRDGRALGAPPKARFAKGIAAPAAPLAVGLDIGRGRRFGDHPNHIKIGFRTRRKISRHGGFDLGIGFAITDFDAAGWQSVA